MEKRRIPWYRRLLLMLRGGSREHGSSVGRQTQEDEQLESQPLNKPRSTSSEEVFPIGSVDMVFNHRCVFLNRQLSTNAKEIYFDLWDEVKLAACFTDGQPHCSGSVV